MAASNTVRNGHAMLREGGHLLLLDYQGENSSESGLAHALESENFEQVHRLPLSESSSIKSAVLAQKGKGKATASTPKVVNLLRFGTISTAGQQLITKLQDLGWTVRTHSHPFMSTSFEGITMVLDDDMLPLLSTVSQEQWATLQAIFNSQNRILWVTEGSQLDVTKPERAQIHGLMRTIRDEDPGINLTTLDVESMHGEHTISAVNCILCFIQEATFRTTGDYEFVERSGTIHISRVLPDDAVNKFSKAEEEGAEPITRSLHDTESGIRLNCERIGNLDSLHFHEISRSPTPLQQDEVEIEIAAAGLNFKDIAISTGLIPGNERLLGFEGSGTVRQSKAELYHPGQRVMYTKPGSFANRLITEADFAVPIPDSLSFEEAATLGAVYPVSLYSLFDLANTHKGSRVLIHSAAGGIGIACIQLCQHVGAEIYVTVGNDEKRKFLIDNFGIDPNRIFNSRSILFAEELMRETHDEGIDVIINSLTGDLLEASWNCIRDGGTLVELGKRDLLERNYLPMEPFQRGVSYRSFDISLKSVPKATMTR